jgi:hypothetical protein
MTGETRGAWRAYGSMLENRLVDGNMEDRRGGRISGDEKRREAPGEV